MKYKTCQNEKCQKPLTGWQVKFCSRSCAAKINNVGKKHSIETRKKISKSLGGKGVTIKHNKVCLNCGTPTDNPKYCSVKCRGTHKTNRLIEQWLAGEIDGCSKAGHASYVKHYLIDKYNSKCSICGWGETNPYTKTIPLEVDHIDGNAYNNVPENVTLICPNCHSLTKTFRGANAGNGRRTYLKKYYINNKGD